MAAPKTGKFKLFFLLFPIPLFWVLFSQLDVFRVYYKRLENVATDWRFQVRGQLDVPEVKVAYADLDAVTISKIGERPYSRRIHAQVASVLFEVGKARAIGYDFVFSREGNSEMVPDDWVKGADLFLGDVIRKYPNIVLAANYTGHQLPKTLEELEIDESITGIDYKRSRMPLYYFNERLPEEAKTGEDETFPEMPTFPVIGQTYLFPLAQDQLRQMSGLPLEGDSPGTVGLIAVDTYQSADAVPRWLPLYTHSQGPYWTLNFLKGIVYFYDTVEFAEYEDTIDEEVEEEEENIVLLGDDVIVRDSDGDFLLSMPYIQDHTFYHITIELILKYFGLTNDAVEVTQDFLIIRDKDGTELVKAPMKEGQITEVNWFSKWINHDLNPRASIIHIIQQYINLRDGEGVIKEEAEEFFKKFNDAIVLVGPVDPILQDLAPTPFDSAPVPKVSVHGNMVKTLMSGIYITRISSGLQITIIFLLTVVVSILGLYSGKLSVLAKTGSGILLVGYVIVSFVTFSTLHILIPLIAPIASAITTTAAGALYQLFVEERQKGRITGMFGTYLSPELVTEMVESGEEPALGGEDVRITAFFSDVQSFSSFSELLEPDQLVTLMNEYLTAMTDILMQEGAYVDKYIGDAIVAMFNAPVHLPGHELRGCIAAAKIQKRQLELRAKWADEGDKWPDIVSKMQTRIGLNTGNATVGNMGSESRFNYTMMGDTVNLAARCESGAKTAGVYSLVTAETMKAAKESGDDVLFRFVDKWQVKGRKKPVDMYEIVGLTADMDQSTIDCVRYYEEGLDRYFALDWIPALNLFERASELEPNQPGITPGVTTNPSLVLLQRCKTLRQHPPDPNYWNGVFVMTTK
ncbi:adenylate/guanylate cyclase domain-containing protein [Rubellicoccus peritrichatus]|uniref:Adenylate/guanylate cyclase domain-containing protein n=1 Tax=Rubellicoccus peritrichatus TaxID=3080537 RepID=A0AAQ3LEH6_9BACT|nr:adenylate/guanylate cyclase domain-containing protein [Puniceicoccus sp. CR14]WOO43222.1 adenylate/guanylate cyclase domain-containing protein [Puniceicoccus sp. CR14]